MSVKFQGKLKPILDESSKFSFLNSVPNFLEDTETHWLTKTSELFTYYQNRRLKLQNSLRQPQVLKSTRKRLQVLEDGLSHNENVFLKLLEPLIKNNGLDLTKTLKYKNTPSHQSLTLYLKNIFRDWSWETGENEIVLKIIGNVLPKIWKPDCFVTLGAGACRLPMDLHQRFELNCSIAVDINPLLFFVAQEMLNQKTLTLYDFPVAPLELSEIAVKNTLNNPMEHPLSNFHLFFADINQLPFKENSVDSVLTPWLIDILPMNLNLIIQRINRILKVGGEWIQFGPLGFMFQDESHCYSFDEIQELLPKMGFKIEKYHTEMVPYLEAPYASQKRKEKILCFRATKVNSTKYETYKYLPSWLLQFDEKIPITDFIQEQQIQSRIQADIVHSIDGKKSVNELTQLMSQHYRISNKEAELTLVSYLVRLYENKIRF